MLFSDLMEVLSLIQIAEDTASYLTPSTPVNAAWSGEKFFGPYRARVDKSLHKNCFIQMLWICIIVSGSRGK